MVECGEHDHPRTMQYVRVTRDRARRSDAVHRAHPNVHEDDVGLERSDQIARLAPVCGFTHDVETGFGIQDRTQADPGWHVVVDDEHPGAHADDRSVGRHARTTKPPWGPVPASNCPPSTVTRSCMPTRPRPLPVPSATAPRSFVVTRLPPSMTSMRKSLGS